ncbi:MAG: C39 family peptidase [Lachnospiraceae bacterium]|nr:C39 family peptidase [Lachnospiraceae bacterium]
MIVSWIPKYVSNRVLLRGYRFLAVFGVPRFVRKKHYRENCIRLDKTNWNFWKTQKAYIENQSEWEEIRFGVGRRQSMRYAGCEIIATYNARKALGNPVSPKDMAELIAAYEARGAALWGAFGVAPTEIAAYFRKNGFAVETADGTEERAVEEIARNYRVMVATAYNDKNDITAQIHTVCITKNRDGKFVLHNAYHRDVKGRYCESRPYDTLQEAAAHLSGREPKLIYLMGIKRMS